MGVFYFIYTTPDRAKSVLALQSKVDNLEAFLAMETFLADKLQVTEEELRSTQSDLEAMKRDVESKAKQLEDRDKKLATRDKTSLKLEVSEPALCAQRRGAWFFLSASSSDNRCDFDPWGVRGGGEPSP